MRRTDRSDGGSAFPKSAPPDSWGEADNGMSFRDWLAGMAIGAVIRQCANDGIMGFPDGAESIEQLFALNAYKIADAMILESEK